MKRIFRLPLVPVLATYHVARDMRSREMLWAAEGQQWQKAWEWLAVTLVLGLLPVWGGASFFLLFEDLDLKRFIDHGEFAIYSAGLLASAILVIFSDYTQAFPNRIFWGLTCFILLILATLIFGAISATQVFPELQEKLDLSVVRGLSFGLFCLTILVGFVLMTLDKVLMSSGPVERLRESQFTSLVENYATLPGETTGAEAQTLDHPALPRTRLDEEFRATGGDS